MISLINHDLQWGRSEVVIIYPYPRGDCSLATAPASGAPAPACARLGWAAARSRWRATAVVRGVARQRSWRRDAPGIAAPGRWPWRSPFRPQETMGKWWENGGKMVKHGDFLATFNNRKFTFFEPTMKHYSDMVSDIESGSMYVYIYIYVYICVCDYVYIYIYTFMCVWHFDPDILSDILSGKYFNILSDSLSGIIPTYFPAYIPTFFLTFYLASILTFFLAFSLVSAPSEISLRLRSGSAHWHLAPTVEVWQCQRDPELPVKNGSAHWDLEFAVGKRRKEEGGREGKSDKI